MSLTDGQEAMVAAVVAWAEARGVPLNWRDHVCVLAFPPEAKGQMPSNWSIWVEEENSFLRHHLGAHILSKLGAPTAKPEAFVTHMEEIFVKQGLSIPEPALAPEPALEPEITEDAPVSLVVALLEGSIASLQAALDSGEWDGGLDALLQGEIDGKDRKGAKDAIEERKELVAAKAGE